MIYKSLKIFYKSSAIFYKRIRIFYNRFYKKQKRFYKTSDRFYKISNIVYNLRNFATPPIMHIKRHLQFNFSVRFQRKVDFTESRVIGFFKTLQLLRKYVKINSEVRKMPDCLYNIMDNVVKNYTNANYKLHNHSEYEIYLYLNGDCKYIIEEKMYDLSRGDIIIIRKHEMHKVFHNSTDKDYHRIIIMVSPEFFTMAGCPEYEDAFLNKSGKVGNKISGSLVHSSGLYDAIMRLKKYTNNFTATSSPIANSTMTEILYLINEISLFEKAETPRGTINNVINYINMHFTEDITLDKLSEIFFVSKYHLCHIFKETTGLTLQQYIKQRRLTLVEDLKKEGITLAQAAATAGFCDYSSFYRAYKKKHKHSPTEKNVETSPFEM